MATTTHITLIIHHRGRLERGSDGKLCYAEGEITEVERVNVDTLNGFFISDLLKDIGYPIISDFYWQQPEIEIEGGLRLLRLDMDVVKMYEAAVENGHKIELYIEHPISQADVVDTNEEVGVEAPDQVNVTPSRRRRKVCVRKTPTPKKATEETHGTEKAQPDASPNPSVPATPNTVHVSEESATPNIVPAPSISLDNNAQPKSPTYTEPPSTSDDPQDEFLTQCVPLPLVEMVLERILILIEQRGDMAPLNTGHNSRGCDKKKEAMASGGAASGSGSQHQGAAATTKGMGVDDLDDDAAREQEMYWEEILEAADTEASASDSPSVNVDYLNCVNPSEEPMAVRPPPSNSSTAYVPPRPIIKPTMSKRPIRRRNIKRPPPSQPSPLRPAPPQPTPITPTTPQPSVVRPTSPTNQLPPRITRQTMHGASRGTTTRFMQFMPTPPSTIQTPGRWPVPGFRPPTGASSSGNNNGISSGSSNSTPNK
ncbi:uncharacterized protein DS421_20g681380 [Arachis hypogaea]|nr:uncharacterized protein DS421_20g681380 [Arachis hypogaea]